MLLTIYRYISVEKRAIVLTCIYAVYMYVQYSCKSTERKRTNAQKYFKRFSKYNHFPNFHMSKTHIEQRDLYDLCIIVSIKIQFVIYDQTVTLRSYTDPSCFFWLFQLHMHVDIHSTALIEWTQSTVELYTSSSVRLIERIIISTILIINIVILLFLWYDCC